MDKMTEVQFMGMLVLTLGSLFALFKVLAKPLITGLTELTKSITSLDMSVQGLKKDMADIKDDLSRETEHSTVARRRLWEHNEQQDKRLDEHDQKILRLEMSHQKQTDKEERERS